MTNHAIWQGSTLNSLVAFLPARDAFCLECAGINIEWDLLCRESGVNLAYNEHERRRRKAAYLIDTLIIGERITLYSTQEAENFIHSAKKALALAKRWSGSPSINSLQLTPEEALDLKAFLARILTRSANQEDHFGVATDIHVELAQRLPAGALARTSDMALYGQDRHSICGPLKQFFSGWRGGFLEFQGWLTLEVGTDAPNHVWIGISLELDMSESDLGRDPQLKDVLLAHRFQLLFVGHELDEWGFWEGHRVGEQGIPFDEYYCSDDGHMEYWTWSGPCCGSDENGPGWPAGLHQLFEQLTSGCRLLFFLVPRIEVEALENDVADEDEESSVD